MIPPLRLIALYLLLLLAHVGNTLEAIYDRVWPMPTLPGLGWFLSIHWFLFALPMLLFFFVLLGQRWAYTLSQVYAVIMILTGAGHILALLVTAHYFHGFGGAVTGVALVIIALFLFRELNKAKRFQV